MQVNGEEHFLHYMGQIKQEEMEVVHKEYGNTFTIHNNVHINNTIVDNVNLLFL